MACFADINVSQGSVACKVRWDFEYPFYYKFTIYIQTHIYIQIYIAPKITRTNLRRYLAVTFF